MAQLNTQQEFEQVMRDCRDLFLKKLHDYGTAWRVMRPATMTDQLFIKAARIRSLQMKGHSEVGEGIIPEFVGIVNYSIIALIQLSKGVANAEDISIDEAAQLYDAEAQKALQLMLKKNHDYNEAWRDMRVSSYTDFILTKIQRVKEMEDLQEGTLVSEGIDSNYMDIINYACFGAIKTVDGQ